MAVYLTADGGGTKLHVLAFDENLRLLGFGVSGGTNTNFIKPEQVEQHMREAVEQALGDRTEVETVWATIVGQSDMFEQAVRERASLGRLILRGEPLAYLLAGALTDNACIALAGTGSGAGYIRQKTVAYNGGFGSDIGDDGSGWWIGSHGVNAVIRAEEGWGPKTALTGLLYEYLKIDGLGGLIGAVYSNPRGARSVSAGFCPWVGRAADGGDAVAAGIVREAGGLLALQLAAAVRASDPAPEPDTPVVCCGGAWNSTPLLFESFREELSAQGVALPVRRARFSPVLHGAVSLLLEQGRNPWDYLDRLQILQDCL